MARHKAGHDERTNHFANSFERFVAPATVRVMGDFRPSGPFGTSSPAAVPPGEVTFRRSVF